MPGFGLGFPKLDAATLARLIQATLQDLDGKMASLTPELHAAERLSQREFMHGLQASGIEKLFAEGLATKMPDASGEEIMEAAISMAIRFGMQLQRRVDAEARENLGLKETTSV